MNAIHVVIATHILLCVSKLAYGVPYQIYVYTGDVFGAGTDARVFVTIYGVNGKSREIELNSNRNDFERDHTDKFEVNVPKLGQLKKLRIRHDNSWFGAGWFLDKVEVKDGTGCVYMFPSHRWLASNVGDGKIARAITTKSTCPRASGKKSKICKHELGMSNGKIKDSQITASSSYDTKHEPYHARLNKVVKDSKGGWCSAFADDAEYLQVDLGKPTVVQGIATQGQALFDNWITRYVLSYSTNGADWTSLKEKGKIRNFTANSDRNTTVTHWFPEIKAKVIRVRPLSWDGLTNCMRIELYGCVEGTKKDIIGKASNQNSRPETKEERESLSVVAKAVLYLRFERIVKGNIIRDQSDLHNDARIVNFARLSRFSENCGKGVDINGGDVLFNGAQFVNKPREQITIALWVKLFSVEGPSSMFDTIGGLNSTHRNGQFHFEVDGGAVRWFHRDEKGNIVFNVTTEVIVPAHIWTHIVGVYDSKTGFAEVYVNAKLVMREEGTGLLSHDWSGKAGIGEHKGERLLDGVVDEFLISNVVLAQDEIKRLMKRCKFEKECFTPIGMEDMKIKDAQVTASSTLQPHKPFYGRLNLISFFDDPKRSAWCSDDDDKEPYLTIDLKDERTISGVAIQGASVLDSFVTSFKVCYSHTGRKYSCVSENATGQALMGNTDKDSVKIHWFSRFFDARFVRFYPLAWYGDSICMRTELYGCITGLLSDTMTTIIDDVIDPTQTELADCSVSCGKGTIRKLTPCTKHTKQAQCLTGNKDFVHRVPCERPSCPDCFAPVGMSAGAVNDSSISGSSSVDEAHPAYYGRVITAKKDVVARRGSWCAGHTDDHQYIEVDLKKPIKVTGVGTQGQVSADHWVTKYRIEYSISKIGWNNYTENFRPKIFTGNDDKDTVAIRHLMHPITARYVRVYPLTWHGGLICMRAEIYGCDNIALYLTKTKSKSKKHGTAIHKPAFDNRKNGAMVRTDVFTNYDYRNTMAGGQTAYPYYPEGTQFQIEQGNGAQLPAYSYNTQESYRTKPFNSKLTSDSETGRISINTPVTLGIYKSEISPVLNQTVGSRSAQLQFATQNNNKNITVAKASEMLPSEANNMLLAEANTKLPATTNKVLTAEANNMLLAEANTKLPATTNKVLTAEANNMLLAEANTKLPATTNKGLTAEANKVLPAEVSKVPPKEDSKLPATGIQAYEWTKFGTCSVTCGRGVKERYRKCNAIECESEGKETQMLPCYNPPCKGSSEWSGYSKCSVTCGMGKRTRTRQCNGKNCIKTGKEVSTITCRKPTCPVLNLDFEEIESHVLVDHSGKGNNAYLGTDSSIVPYKGVCGHYAELGEFGNILLEDLTFRSKPKYGISVAGWVNMMDTIKGSHSIFSTARAINIGQIIGGYHFEVDDGRIRWFHRTRKHNPVFSVLTENLVRPDVWFHVVGTYQSSKATAKVYIDGELKATAPGYGLLDTDWGYKASVGSFDFDGRFIRAKIDDFYMFDYEISPTQVQDLLIIKCPEKKKS